jgi:hypothetical protein
MNWRLIFEGRLSGKYIRNVYLPFPILFLGICFLLAGTMYTEFSFFYDDISYLGNANLNPKGYFYWSIGMAGSGFLILLLIPSLLLRFNKIMNPNFLGKSFFESNHTPNLKLIVQYALNIGKFFIVLFPIGMIGLGILQEAWFPPIIHQINATLAFGGLFLGVFFIGFLIIFTKEISKMRKIWFSVLGYFGPLAMVISQGLKYLEYGSFDRYCGFGEPGYCALWFVFSLYEWLLFFSALGCVFVFFYIVFSERFEP